MCPGGSKADGFNLDVVALTFSKPVGEGEWGAGYNATLLFGPDAVGYNNSAGSSKSDFSLKDAYVDLHAPVGNGLDFKLGTFTEILGYEVYETGNNPNYTRSYGYEIEPTALTGGLLTYQFSPVITAQAGIANTWSAGIDNRSSPPKAESFKTYMGGLTLTAPDSLGFLAGSTLSGGVINGYDAVTTQAIKTSFYVGGTFKTPIKTLSVGLAYDYMALDHNTTTDPGTGDLVPHNSGYQNAGCGLSAVAGDRETELQHPRGILLAERLSGQFRHAARGLRPDRNGPVSVVEERDQPGGIPLGPFAERSRRPTAAQCPIPAPSLKNAWLVAANVIYKF